MGGEQEGDQIIKGTLIEFLYLNSSLCFLAELSPREPVEPLDEELPVVEQLLDI